ncbi:hypothetical protein, partial [Capnocytophaga sp. oral taxon 324]|uniref:hypothetical protein n=1 Tax=Capnocytophaga sp. oral taxon 324 TaxID=712211 RepID=UPI0012FCD0AD
MNNLIAKMAYRIIFVVAFLFAVNHLNAQSTPKVGITQLIGCGIGNNVNKAEVTVSVDESLSGYQYNFGGGWVNTNKAWLIAGNYTVQVKKGTEYYHTLPITVPTKATAPTYNSKIIYNCNGTGNVTLTNDQPTYQHSYTYKGVTKTDPHFSNLTTGVHSISVTYTVPPTTKAIIFYDDFGKKTGNVKSVKSLYVNQNIYFDPMNGADQVRPDGATRSKTVADSYYAIGNRTDMMAGTTPYSSSWVLPNDKDGDANGRFLWYNVDLFQTSPGETKTVYKRKVKVTPGLPVEFSAYVYNPINPSVSALAGYIPKLVLEVYRSEATFNAKTPAYKSNEYQALRTTNLNGWHQMSVTANLGASDTELIFVIRILGGGNDLCVDNILVTQTSKSCPFTQIVPITIEANPNPPTITTQPVASVVYCKNTTIANALNINATTTTGTLSYKWFENTTNSTTGGNQVATTQTYKPQTTVAGIKYYYAVVSNGCGVATSTVAKVEVLFPPEVTQITATPATFKQGESASVVFTIKGTPNAQVTYNINGTGTQVVTLNSSGTYTLPSRTVNQTTILNVTKVKLGACEQNYTDKSGGILATTAKCTTKPAPQFPTSSPNGRTAVMNGVTVTRTYSKPSATILVYGTIDNDGYCSGTPYHNYTIIHTKPNFSPKVIYTFSQPVTSAEVWLMVMGSSNTKYDKVKLSINNGTPTFTKVYDCAEGKGQAGATLSNTGEVTSQDRIITDVAVRVTSNTPFTQLIVEDIHPGSSGVLVELCPASITPAETISITTQPQSQTICADKMATFTSKAQLKDTTGDIQYKWQQSSNGTTWTDIPASTGSIASGGTASLTIAGTTNYKYRVVYSYQFAQGIVVTATSQEATLTKLPSVALPTLITGSKTLCPTATNNTVSFANYVTAPTGTTLLWYTAPAATVSSTTAPVINTHVTTRTTQTAYVRALSTAGCTSGIVTVTLTVDDTTAPTFTAPTPLNIVCNSTTATTAINNWLGTTTATDACGAIATITNNYNAPADLCTVPGGIITVTFVAKDTFGNTKTGTSTIHLGVTPLVVQDDTFNIPNG